MWVAVCGVVRAVVRFAWPGVSVGRGYVRSSLNTFVRALHGVEGVAVTRLALRTRVDAGACVRVGGNSVRSWTPACH